MHTLHRRCWRASCWSRRLSVCSIYRYTHVRIAFDMNCAYMRWIVFVGAIRCRKYRTNSLVIFIFTHSISGSPAFSRLILINKWNCFNCLTNDIVSIHFCYKFPTIIIYLCTYEAEVLAEGTNAHTNIHQRKIKTIFSHEMKQK